MSIPAGTRLGHYEIVWQIGSGGMGEVYLAKDNRLGRKVAIKFLPKFLQQDDEARQRFEREARAVSSLNHPHILTIHEFGEVQFEGDTHTTHYMVTEFIEGETLRDLMHTERDGKKIIEYLAQAADALAKAHSARMVHRDLKPENIMITNDGYAKVLDFGLAKRVTANRMESSRAPTAHYETQEGFFVGTVGYVSPEQARSAAVDHRADVFSFGCILYEAVTGHRAFEAGSIIDTLHQVIHSRPTPVPEEVPREIRRVIERCLAKSPEDRYDSMKVVAQELRESTKSFVIPSVPLLKPKGRSSARQSARLRSIAVLPFVNTSGDPDTEYLSDGLTESIILSLSQLRKLKVMARSTVFAYKGTEISPQQIARDLRVGSIVTGRVRHVSGDLLIHIELVNARDGSHLWGDRYRRPFSDLLDVQEEIARQISENLKLQLSNLEKKRLARRPTRRTEAYNLYLKGRYHANKRTLEGVRRAAQYFEDAIAIDSQYALAHAGLADCYAILSSRALASPEEGYPKAEQAARTAIELDPTLAAPHATLGSLQLLYHWNWGEAEREFRESLDLDPDYPTAHHWYSVYLNTMGRHDEAIREAGAALELEPLSLLLNVHLADMLYYGRQIDAAVDQSLRAIELDENFFLGHFLLGRCLEAQGDVEKAIRCYEYAIQLEGRYPELLAELACAKASLGDTTAARHVLSELEEISRTEFVSPRFFAEVHAALGDDSAALEALETHFRRRGELEQILVGPRFEQVRRNLRFDEMLVRVGFPRIDHPEAVQITHR